jgi:hypothetical protein
MSALTQHGFRIAVFLAGLVAPASAQTFGLAPSTSVSLPTAADVLCTCPIPPGACSTAGPTVMVSGFLGSDVAWISDSLCIVGLTSRCGCRSRGSALVRVSGLGTGSVTIRWDAIAWANHDCVSNDQHSGPCNCPSTYLTSAAAGILMSIDLDVLGLPAGTPVTVFYRWKQLSANMYAPEAPGDDTSSVSGGSASVGGTPLFAGGFDLVGVKGVLAGPSVSGSLGTTAGSVVTVASMVSLFVEIAPPARGSTNPCLEYDSESTAWGGEIVLSLLGPPPPPAPDDCPEDPELEFSVDLASASELSDLGADFNDRFDPGDVYPAGGSLLPLGGADGVRDDAALFAGLDPAPDAPDGPPAASAAPVCSGLPPPAVAPGFFDLDGTDAVDFSLVGLVPAGSPLPAPIPRFDTPCVHETRFLLLSYDDDGAGHYVDANPFSGTCEIPILSPSPAGATHGSAATSDEIVGAILVPTLAGASVATYPVASEARVHASLAPNPPAAAFGPFAPSDDDVDALDANLGSADCTVWLFSVDHEATMASLLPLADPGGVYELAPGGPVQVVDEAIHLGIPETADLDAFELVWVPDTLGGAGDVLALLFSVDDDDPLTPPDESGGLDPAMLYLSDLTGFSFPLLAEPLPDDVDALTAWCRPLLRDGRGQVLRRTGVDGMRTVAR